jgi:glucokinase
MSHTPVVLGLDFGGTKIATAVCDLAGNRIASAVVDAQGEQGARASFDRGVQAARELLAEAVENAMLAAVGVATFGIPFEDRVDLAPAISGWSTLPMGRELRRAFPGTPITMATDAKAAAAAEVRWGALAGYDPAVYLNLGTGLAIAIVAGGKVIAGHNGASGEIGYNLRSPGDVAVPDGQRIMLEDMVSGLALARRAAEAGLSLTAAEMFAAGHGDKSLDRVITDFVDELAFHLVNAAILINPARIAVGGGMVGSWARIGPRLAEALSRAVPFPPELVVAHFPQDAPLLGAIALAVDAAVIPVDVDRARPGPASGPAISNEGIAV